MLCGSPQYNYGIFYNFEILVCPTPLSQLTENYDNNYEGNTPQVIFSAETLDLNWINNEWHGFVFGTPFSYNGTDNLIFEFRWQGDNSNAVYVKGWYPPGGNRILDGYSLTSPTGALREYMNLLRIYYTPVNIDEDLASPVIERCLIMNYQNPFHDNTIISYQLPQSSHVTISIYDATGKLINTLINQNEEKGYHSVKWNGKDRFGQAVGNGIFFCQLRTDNLTLTKRIIPLQ
jgi:hypothetical protein